MYLRNLLFAFLTSCGFAAIASADEANLSRVWHSHFWLWEHSDVAVTVYHLPNGTIRAVGRFSNGLQTIDRKFGLAVLVENTNGEAWHVVLDKHIPATGPGSTEVGWRTHELGIVGTVNRVYARAVINNHQSGSFGLKVECDYGPHGTNCGIPKPFYKEDKAEILKTYRVLEEQAKIDICEGVARNVHHNNFTAFWTECDSNSGKITQHSKALEHPIRPCPTCSHW